MMRQLYPDKELEDGSNTGLLLEGLRIKIDREHSEIEEFKKGYLFA
jgi:hypothetical protein